MVAPLLGHLASWLSATISTDQSAVFAALPAMPGGVFWIVGLVLLVIAACELAGLRYIANNRVGVVEKLWSVKGSVPEGGSSRSTARRGFRRRSCVAALHFGSGGGSSGSTGCRWSRSRKARSAMFMPATAKHCCRARRWARLIPATTFKTPARFLGGEVDEPRPRAGSGPARPPASHPA